MPPSYLFLILASVSLNAVAQIFLRKAMLALNISDTIQDANWRSSLGVRSIRECGQSAFRAWNALLCRQHRRLAFSSVLASWECTRGDALTSTGSTNSLPMKLLLEDGSEFDAYRPVVGEVVLPPP